MRLTRTREHHLPDVSRAFDASKISLTSSCAKSATPLPCARVTFAKRIGNRDRIARSTPFAIRRSANDARAFGDVRRACDATQKVARVRRTPPRVAVDDDDALDRNIIATVGARARVNDATMAATTIDDRGRRTMERERNHDDE